MAKRKIKLTDNAGFMVFLFIGLFIAGTVEGINIARNVKYFYTSSERVEAGEYVATRYYIKPSERINLYIRVDRVPSNATELPITFALMRESKFEVWNDQTAPSIINSTYFIKRAYVNADGISVHYGDDYYFVFFNDNAEAVEIYITFRIIPWGHIIATAAIGVPALATVALFLFEMFSTGFFRVKSQVEKEKQDDGNQTIPLEESDKETIDENFCPSCGAPISEKDERYCPQCGASVNIK